MTGRICVVTLALAVLGTAGIAEQIGDWTWQVTGETPNRTKSTESDNQTVTWSPTGPFTGDPNCWAKANYTGTSDQNCHIQITVKITQSVTGQWAWGGHGDPNEKVQYDLTATAVDTINGLLQAHVNNWGIGEGGECPERAEALIQGEIKVDDVTRTPGYSLIAPWKTWDKEQQEWLWDPSLEKAVNQDEWGDSKAWQDLDEAKTVAFQWAHKSRAERLADQNPLGCWAYATIVTDQWIPEMQPSNYEIVPE